MFFLIVIRILFDLIFDNVCWFLVNDIYLGRFILFELFVFVLVRLMILYFEMKFVNLV